MPFCWFCHEAAEGKTADGSVIFTDNRGKDWHTSPRTDPGFFIAGQPRQEELWGAVLLSKEVKTTDGSVIFTDNGGKDGIPRRVLIQGSL